MGPLPFSSGNLSECSGTSTGVCSFNGAAAFQQRKSEAKRITALLSPIASMGPLPFSSGNARSAKDAKDRAEIGFNGAAAFQQRK